MKFTKSVASNDSEWPQQAVVVMTCIFCLALFAAPAQRADGATSPCRPNIVLLFADDMNYAGPSCYGSRWDVKTPALDRLAEEGVRFTDASVSAPTCGPSRAGLITGRQQTRFGHEFNSPRREGIGLPLTEKTIADRMKALGFPRSARRLMAGKPNRVSLCGDSVRPARWGNGRRHESQVRPPEIDAAIGQTARELREGMRK